MSYKKLGGQYNLDSISVYSSDSNQAQNNGEILNQMRQYFDQDEGNSDDELDNVSILSVGKNKGYTPKELYRIVTPPLDEKKLPNISKIQATEISEKKLRKNVEEDKKLTTEDKETALANIDLIVKVKKSGKEFDELYKTLKEESKKANNNRGFGYQIFNFLREMFIVPFFSRSSPPNLIPSLMASTLYEVAKQQSKYRTPEILNMVKQIHKSRDLEQMFDTTYTKDLLKSADAIKEFSKKPKDLTSKDALKTLKSLKYLRYNLKSDGEFLFDETTKKQLDEAIKKIEESNPYHLAKTFVLLSKNNLGSRNDKKLNEIKEKLIEAGLKETDLKNPNIKKIYKAVDKLSRDKSFDDKLSRDKSFDDKVSKLCKSIAKNEFFEMISEKANADNKHYNREFAVNCSMLAISTAMLVYSAVSFGLNRRDYSVDVSNEKIDNLASNSNELVDKAFSNRLDIENLIDPTGLGSNTVTGPSTNSQGLLSPVPPIEPPVPPIEPPVPPIPPSVNSKTGLDLDVILSEKTNKPYVKDKHKLHPKESKSHQL